MTDEISRFPAGISWLSMLLRAIIRGLDRFHKQSSNPIKPPKANQSYKYSSRKKEGGISQHEIQTLYKKHFAEHYTWCLDRGCDSRIAKELILKTYLSIWRMRAKIFTQRDLISTATAMLRQHLDQHFRPAEECHSP